LENADKLKLENYYKLKYLLEQNDILALPNLVDGEKKKKKGGERSKHSRKKKVLNSNRSTWPENL